LVYSKGLHSRLGLPQKFLASGVSDRSKESGLILQQRVLSSNNNENGIGTERETEREREKTESGSGVLELELVWGPASGIKESPFFIDFSSSEMKKRLMKCKTELLVKTMGDAYAHADANIDANNNNNAIGSANVAEANTEGEGEGGGERGGGERERERVTVVDFTAGLGREGQYKDQQKEKGRERVTVVDFTAGLGRDSLLLAASGFNVIMLERNLIMYVNM